MIPGSGTGSITPPTDGGSPIETGERANGSDSSLSRDQGPALKCADIPHGTTDRGQSIGQGTISIVATGRPDLEQQRSAKDPGIVSNSGMARHRRERELTGRASVALHAGKLPLEESAAEALSAGQANAEVKAAGAVRRDIREATEDVRVADLRAVPSSGAVRAAASRAESAGTARPVAVARAADKAADARVVRPAAVRAADFAGSRRENCHEYFTELLYAQGRKYE